MLNYTIKCWASLLLSLFMRRSDILPSTLSTQLGRLAFSTLSFAFGTPAQHSQRSAQHSIRHSSRHSGTLAQNSEHSARHAAQSNPTVSRLKPGILSIQSSFPKARPNILSTSPNILNTQHNILRLLARQILCGSMSQTLFNMSVYNKTS